MLNLSKIELRFIAKKRSVSGYKNMSKDELIDAINISKPAKNNKKNIFKPKEKMKKKNTFKQKRKEVKKSLMTPSKKKTLKSKMKEIKEILYDPILDRDEKIEEIKKSFIIQEKNLFEPKKDKNW